MNKSEVEKHILDKNLMILASAGSGKTYQLGNRVVGMIRELEADPERIVALTFTRKAAGEFSDSILQKLADDPEATAALERFVKALPRLQFGTMDGFFSRIVRGFQYELGISGGNFELLQGAPLETAMQEILTGVLSEVLDGEYGEEFFHAFRRATMGSEGFGVLNKMQDFVGVWHGYWKEGSGSGFGRCFTELPDVKIWEEQKHGAVAALRTEEDSKTLKVVWDAIEAHTIGSGSLGKVNTLYPRLLDEVPGEKPIEVKDGRKMLAFDVLRSQKCRTLFNLLARCELAASCARTEAVGQLVERVDKEVEIRLRKRGLLTFDDVKKLLGGWTRSEDARLQRELVDYRLDARYDHWFLDEFQDTSPSEWEALEPLLDEAAGEGEGSLFVVGDRKQAIYGWRGGDVRLFDQVEKRYGDGMKVCTMPKSYRSCPAVLNLVNRVCGDLGSIADLFGQAIENRWEWEDHESAWPDLLGESQVEVVASADACERLCEKLTELGVGEKQLSCGVLVRTKDHVRKFSDFLRERGFNVIEEGQRQSTQDHPVGVALMSLFSWLADPSDQIAVGVVAMSPFEKILNERWGSVWQARWEGLLELAQSGGYGAMIEDLLRDYWEGLSSFAQRRVKDIAGALSEFDAGGDGNARAARDWINELEVPQAPGAAAVQVMTIHKSKGLGFDLVFLPELSDKQIPNLGDFKVARGADWVLQPPADWVRNLVTELKEAEERWSEDQRYEALCVLYVALTRAKRGLYVFLPELPKSRDAEEDWRSLPQLIRRAIGGDEFVSGDSAWTKVLPSREQVEPVVEMKLARKVELRPRATPSSNKKSVLTSGAKMGEEVHLMFEEIAWLETKEIPRLPLSAAGKLVEDALKVTEVHRLFERQKGMQVYREQAIEVIFDGKWMTGVIDRLLVTKDLVTVIDFKTDAVRSADELLMRYSGQMQSYADAMKEIFDREVECVMVSTKLKKVVSMKGRMEQGELLL